MQMLIQFILPSHFKSSDDHLPFPGMIYVSLFTRLNLFHLVVAQLSLPSLTSLGLGA